MKALNHYDDKTPINKIHLTFLKLKKRHEKRRKEFSDFIKEIKKIIKPTNDNYYLFYKNDNYLFKIEISFNKTYGDWGYSHHTLSLKNREEKLDYLEDTELKFELGKKFIELEKLSSSIFFYYLQEVILNKLKYKFQYQSKYYFNDMTEIIIINNMKYLFIKRDRKEELIDLEEKIPVLI